MIPRTCPHRLVLLLVLLAAGYTSSAQDDQLQAVINKAIDRGVENLRRLGGTGSWSATHYPTGMSALAAWTLLESGVAPSDPLVQRAAANLRRECINLTNTYSLTTAILFFDRLGDSGDEALIQAMAVRLLAGQNLTGSWNYEIRWGEDADRAWLQRQVEEANKQRQNKTLPAEAKKMIFPEIQKQLDRLQRANIDPRNGDNSNTQFAMIGLWVARRHGMPVDSALGRVDARFRRSQTSGGWAYAPEVFFGSPPRATMTCAGLLGLALGQGVKKDGKGKELLKDPIVKNGFRLISEVLKNPNGEMQKKLLVKPEMFYYFLFSLERMAVVYDVKKIGETDWYTWGAKILVDKQEPDGSWKGEHGAADTCFALLFLKRANVAEDLTFDLKGIVKPAPKKKKLKESERERDPFDLPPDKEKKKIKIRPKDKESGFLTPSYLRERLDGISLVVSRPLDFCERETTSRFLMRNGDAIWASAPPVRRWSW
ncbi:MAG TPA: hypothetical protein VKE98_02760 [Gemmataceae bacterium]|nr:hypothetical protein [Gemmataceae bacterium]